MICLDMITAHQNNVMIVITALTLADIYRFIRLNYSSNI